MRKFLKSTQFKVFALVLCAVLAGAVLASVSASGSSPFTSVVSVVFSPLQKLSGKLSEKLDWFGSSFARAGTYRNENEQLRQQLDEYEKKLADYDEMKHKISSYEDMLGVKEENPDLELCRAEIIGTDSADLFTSLILDKGTSDGVAAGDPVVSGNYVVGVIKKVNPTYSVVETILNPSVNISALESETRETAYVTAATEQSLSGKCIFAGLERTTDVSPGGIVLTSGIGGVYPKGFIIGTVSQVFESEYDLTSYAVITPGARFAELEDVFVVTDFKGQGIEQIESED